MKTKDDYPLVLTAQDVAEIMRVSEATARKYIGEANKKMEAEGFMKHVARRALVPRDRFFRLMGIAEGE